MELTKSQLNYIIAIKQLIGSEVSQKYICEYLGIKKPTASIALRNLEEGGYIEKIERAGKNEYTLTDKSWEIIDNIEKEKFEFISLFHDYLGLDFNVCESEYKRVCGDLSPEFVNRLSNIRSSGYADNVSASKTEESFFGTDIGIYEIPFQVVHGNEGAPSMGDRGFVHPAKLIIDSGRQDIILESRQIYYKSKNEQMLRGELSKLYYLDSNMKWVLSKKAEENKWIIPVKKILCQKGNYGKISLGIAKIKAVATTKKMPESVAEITFNFKLIKKI